MPNLYHDTAEPAARLPPLESDVQADVVIVGAGFTGLSTALHLAEAGSRVVLLESRQPGFGASGRNGGQVNPGLKPDPDVVERDFGADLGGRMNRLAGAAPALVFALIDRLQIDCDARRNGTLRAAITPAGARRVRQTVEQWQRRGAPVESLSGAGLAHATGTPRYREALFDRRGGDLHPLRYVRGLAHAAGRAGAALYGETPALAVERHGSQWRVTTARGAVTAERVVIATNGYSDGLWPGLQRSIVPLFGALAATAPLNAALSRDILPYRSVLYESGAITVYYRVDAANRLLIGGRGPMREIDSAAAIPHILDYARLLWPALQGVEFTHAWGGRLAMTRDHYPHIHEPAPGVLVCLGYNGRGVAMATAMGAQLANRILDPAGPFDMPLTGLETIPLHSFWPLAVQGAIVRGRLQDALGL